MSSGTILFHLGGGLYSVKVHHSQNGLDARATEIVKQLSTIDDDIQKKQTEIDSLSTKYYQTKALLDVAIEQYNATLSDTDKKNMVTANDNFLLVLIRYSDARGDISELKALKTSLQTEQVELMRVQPIEDAIESIWCADLADGLNGRAIYSKGDEVSIYCFGYDPSVKLLAPINSGAASLGQTGLYNYLENQTKLVRAASAYVNVALEVGFAKWLPILLKGTIVKIKEDRQKNCSDPVSASGDQNDTALVELDNYYRFNNSVSYGTHEFPITYFDGSKSFQVGDRVAVSISDMSEKGIPTGEIIGYVSNPKAYHDKAGNRGFVGNHNSNPSSTQVNVSAQTKTEIMSGTYVMPDTGDTKAWRTKNIKVSAYTIDVSGAVYQHNQFSVTPRITFGTKRSDETVYTDVYNYKTGGNTSDSYSATYSLGSITIPFCSQFSDYTHYYNNGSPTVTWSFRSMLMLEVTSFCVETRSITYTWAEMFIDCVDAPVISSYFTAHRVVRYWVTTIDCNGEETTESTSTLEQDIQYFYEFGSGLNAYFDNDQESVQVGGTLTKTDSTPAYTGNVLPGWVNYQSTLIASWKFGTQTGSFICGA